MNKCVHDVCFLLLFFLLCVVFFFVVVCLFVCLFCERCTSNSPAAPAVTRTRDLLNTSPSLYQWAVAAPLCAARSVSASAGCTMMCLAKKQNKTKQLVVTFRWKTSVKCPFSPQGCYLSNLCVSQRWKGSVDKGVWKWGFTCLIHCSWSKAVSQVLFWGR